MGARGFSAVEEGHIVTLYYPLDIDTLAGADSPVIVLMENYTHATIIYSIGVNPLAAGVVTIESVDDTTPTTPTEIAFPYYRYETSQIAANADVPGARTLAVAAAGLIPVATGTPAMYVIEITDSMLVSGDVGFRMCIADPAAASVGSAVAILSGSRYAKSSATQMAVV